jgi:hypothetical protein
MPATITHTRLGHGLAAVVVVPALISDLTRGT